MKEKGRALCPLKQIQLANREFARCCKQHIQDQIRGQETPTEFAAIASSAIQSAVSRGASCYYEKRVAVILTPQVQEYLKQAKKAFEIEFSQMTRDVSLESRKLSSTKSGVGFQNPAFGKEGLQANKIDSQRSEIRELKNTKSLLHVDGTHPADHGGSSKGSSSRSSSSSSSQPIKQCI
jgi:hypothetical protein